MASALCALAAACAGLATAGLDGRGSVAEDALVAHYHSMAEASGLMGAAHERGVPEEDINACLEEADAGGDVGACLRSAMGAGEREGGGGAAGALAAIEEDLRAEKVSALLQRLRDHGVPAAEIAAVYDAEDTKGAIIALLLPLVVGEGVQQQAQAAEGDGAAEPIDVSAHSAYTVGVTLAEFDEGRGLAAAQPGGPGDILLWLPEAELLRPSEHPELRSRPWAAAALALATEWEQGSDSRWYMYLRSLPFPGPDNAAMWPAARTMVAQAFTAEDGSGVSASIGNATSCWEDVKPFLPPDSMDLSESELRWLCALALSRQFSQRQFDQDWEVSDSYMAPLLDMANHQLGCPDATRFSRRLPRAARQSLRAEDTVGIGIVLDGRSVADGQQLFDCYRQPRHPSNLELLSVFGFAIPGNPAGSVRVLPRTGPRRGHLAHGPCGAVLDDVFDLRRYLRTGVAEDDDDDNDVKHGFSELGMDCTQAPNDRSFAAECTLTERSFGGSVVVQAALGFL